MQCYSILCHIHLPMTLEVRYEQARCEKLTHSSEKFKNARHHQGPPQRQSLLFGTLTLNATTTHETYLCTDQYTKRIGNIITAHCTRQHKGDETCHNHNPQHFFRSLCRLFVFWVGVVFSAGLSSGWGGQY